MVLAQTPPMGWNSWDCFGTTVTEAEVLAVRERLPVAGTTFTADRVADTECVCDWNTDNFGMDHGHPGAQAYYDSQLALFAEWGVDFVKADDMLGPYFMAEIAAYRRAMGKSGRDMVRSLSPGRVLSLAHLDHLRSNAQMWRVSDDLWDKWDDVESQFARMARWAPHRQPGAWADADMLPIGRIAHRAERGPERITRLTQLPRCCVEEDLLAAGRAQGVVLGFGGADRVLRHVQRTVDIGMSKVVYTEEYSSRNPLLSATESSQFRVTADPLPGTRCVRH